MMNQQGRLRTRVAVFACVSAVALIADQLTKAWAMAALSDGQSIRVIPGLLSLTLVRNPGASLGMGSGATWVISLLAIVALGNLIDRVMYADSFLNGKVVDFLNYGWSVGNVADVYLVVAAVVLVVLILIGEPFSQKELDEKSAHIADSSSDSEADAE